MIEWSNQQLRALSPELPEWGLDALRAFRSWARKQIGLTAPGPQYLVMKSKALLESGCAMWDWTVVNAIAAFDDQETKEFLRKLRGVPRRQYAGEEIEWKDMLGFDPENLRPPEVPDHDCRPG
jgi:hypothetical protein